MNDLTYTTLPSAVEDADRKKFGNETHEEKKIAILEIHFRISAISWGQSQGRCHLGSNRGSWSCVRSVGAGRIALPVAQLPGEKKQLRCIEESNITNTHWQRWQGLLVRSLFSLFPPANAMERYGDAGLLAAAQAVEAAEAAAASSSLFLL